MLALLGSGPTRAQPTLPLRQHPARPAAVAYQVLLPAHSAKTWARPLAAPRPPRRLQPTRSRRLDHPEDACDRRATRWLLLGLLLFSCSACCSHQRGQDAQTSSKEKRAKMAPKWTLAPETTFNLRALLKGRAASPGAQNATRPAAATSKISRAAGVSMNASGMWGARSCRQILPTSMRPCAPPCLRCCTKATTPISNPCWLPSA